MNGETVCWFGGWEYCTYKAADLPEKKAVFPSAMWDASGKTAESFELFLQMLEVLAKS